MHPTANCRRAVFLASVTAVLAACSTDAPTATLERPSAANMSGVGFGSGNRSDSTTSTPQSTTAADSGSAAGRGGVGFGSGN
jgi:hypothetical protein